MGETARRPDRVRPRWHGLLRGLLAWCLFTGTAHAGTALIPREALFSHADHGEPQLSPDGTWLSYLAPDGRGRPAIWIRSASGGKGRGRIVASSAQGIVGYRWAEDDVHVVYWSDADGDENWHLYAADVKTGLVRDLTPVPGIKARNLLTDPGHPGEILVGINERDRSVADMYRIDLRTGRRALVAQNPGDVLSWTADGDFDIRGATAFDPASADTVLRVRDGPAAPWRDLARWSFGEAPFLGQVNGGSVSAGFSSAGSIYALSTTGADKSRLVTIDLSTGRQRVVGQGDCPIAEDVAEMPGSAMPEDFRPVVMRNPGSGDVEAVALDCDSHVWVAIAPAVAEDLAWLKSRVRGFPYVVSRDRRDARWIVADISGDRPITYQLFDRGERRLRPAFGGPGRLARYRLARPQAMTFTARDGLRIPVYLTRTTTRAAPLVVLPHGGPWVRDHDAFDPEVQLLANRGCAVLQVEYRGSAGYGQAFLNAGDHEFGLKMRDDVVDATEWAIREGIAQRGRIAIMGGSAGGYLALRATEARPDLYRATVDMVGPTDIKYQIESMNSSSLPVRTRWLRRVGDVVNDPALNRRLSPRFEGAMPDNAFLIVQGANDPRVNRANSDRLAASLRAGGTAVTYLLYRDEGHGLSRPENQFDFYGRLEAFLADRIGGRRQPWVEQRSANVEVTR